MKLRCPLLAAILIFLLAAVALFAYLYPDFSQKSELGHDWGVSSGKAPKQNSNLGAIDPSEINGYSVTEHESIQHLPFAVSNEEQGSKLLPDSLVNESFNGKSRKNYLVEILKNNGPDLKGPKPKDFNKGVAKNANRTNVAINRKSQVMIDSTQVAVNDREEKVVYPAKNKSIGYAKRGPQADKQSSSQMVTEVPLAPTPAPEADKQGHAVEKIYQQAPQYEQEARSFNFSQTKEFFNLTRTPVALVLSTFYAEFSLLSKGDHQFVAFYSPTRMMTVAQRTLGNSKWRFKELSSKIGWDNHNWIVLGLDETGCLHVSGNMHASPLVYYRASKPLDIDSLVQEHSMVRYMEYQMTYPIFLNTPHGELVYCYRHGVPTSGGIVMNIYNSTARTWRRLHGGDGLLITGMAVPGTQDMSPYTSLRRGPDGRYHLIWLWRNSLNASSCHHLCYARSLDLRRWQTADGRQLATPITFLDTDQVRSCSTVSSQLPIWSSRADGCKQRSTS